MSVIQFPRADVAKIASRTDLARATGEILAAGLAEIVGELGLDPHQIVAAVATAVEIFVDRHIEPPQHELAIRIVACEIERRADRGRGARSRRLLLLQTLSRLVADCDAALKLAPEIWHASQEPLATARRLMAEAGFQRCRVCGCSELDACPGGCSWVEGDLCSCCAGENHPSAEDTSLFI